MIIDHLSKNRKVPCILMNAYHDLVIMFCLAAAKLSKRADFYLKSQLFYFFEACMCVHMQAHDVRNF